jgi:hypothetical protein
MPLVVVTVSTFVLTMGASLLGVFVGRRRQSQVDDQERLQIFGIEASLLGLLALLLGFSFGMGQTRYDARRRLVLDEANAISTSRLRAATVEDELGGELQSLLTQYVDSRVAIARAQTQATLLAAVAQSERIQREVWSRAVELAKKDPRSLPVSLLLQSLNQMIDLHTLRVGEAQNHIPAPVLLALIVVAVAAMAWVGVGFGSTGHRGMVTSLILSSLIAFVITLIVDLDQPRSGLIRVDYSPLVDLQRSLH